MFARGSFGGRVRVAAVVGVSATVVAVAGLATADPAAAATVATTYTCSVAGASGPVTASTTATASPDPVAPGGTVALTVQAGTPLYPGFDATIETLTVEVPRPAQVSAITGVTFSGGNVSGTWEATPSGVELVFTGPVSTESAVLPTYTLTGTVALDTAGQTISWAAPVVSSYLLTGETHFYSDCLPAAGATIATTAVGAPTTTTTATTTSTSTSTTSTTRPASALLTVGDVAVSEAAGSAVFTLTLDRPATVRTTVSYATANGTAVAGSDYTAKTGTVAFAVGQSSKTVAVTVRNDTVAESAETFVLNVSIAGSGLDPAVAHRLTGTATIADNDTATLSVVDRSLVEGRNTRAVAVTVRLTAASTTQTVTWATADGTATVADNDYRAGSGTLTFAPGETSKTVNVTVVGDTRVEGTETFEVRLLAAAGGAVIGDGTAVVTLTNDD
jgi:hypothetical protein